MQIEVTGNESGFLGHATLYETAFGFMMHLDVPTEDWQCHEHRKKGYYGFIFTGNPGVKLAEVILRLDEDYECFIKSDGTNCVILLIKQEQIDDAAETAQPKAQYLP